MEFIRKLLFNSSTSNDKLKLKYDKDYSNWTVVQGGSIVYVGSQEQCKTYMDYQAANQAGLKVS